MPPSKWNGSWAHHGTVGSLKWCYWKIAGEHMTLRIGARRLSRSLRTKQHGAALLVALLIAALVTITLTVMLQRQSALAGVEWQMRETTQARRILYGAEDWAVRILREDARRSVIDHLGEPWAIPLQEGRLADFLKASPDTVSASATDLDDSRVQDVWLSGRIVDADRRYNLMRLAVAGSSVAQERALWLRVAAQAGLPAELGVAVADRFTPPDSGSTSSGPSPQQTQPPLSLAHLIAQLPALAPWAVALSELIIVLPETTTINVNTAAKPVLMALIRGLDERQAERFMDLRRKAPWRDLNSIGAAFIENALTVDATQAGVASRYFILTAGVRLGVGTPGSQRATEVSLTTTVERFAQDNRTRIVRRDFGAALR